MRIAVLYNDVPEGAAADQQDVLVQVDAVWRSLEQNGHETVVLPCTLDLEALEVALKRLQPDLVFNLVEALGGSDRLMHLPAALLDALGFPYTGCSSESLLITGHKLLSKQYLAHFGLPTPEWLVPDRSFGPPVERLEPPYVIKTVTEHASFGLNDAAVVYDGRPEEALARTLARAGELGKECFAERYIDGREFNLSLLEGPEGAEVLPVAEIDFGAFPPGKPKIVGYAAKWDADSFEYVHTPRRYDFPAEDRLLLEQLESLARRCWQLFGLRGYARVDFRVDRQGQPWILEINANPCLSPDAGFAAALAEAGIAFPQAVERLVRAARRQPTHNASV